MSVTLALTACHHASSNGDGGTDDMDVGDGGDPFVGDGGMACATQSAKAELSPLDILLILDTSASMDYLGKWTSVRLAVKSPSGSWTRYGAFT